jgi:hypothetical protein
LRPREKEVEEKTKKGGKNFIRLYVQTEPSTSHSKVINESSLLHIRFRPPEPRCSKRTASS